MLRTQLHYVQGKKWKKYRKEQKGNGGHATVTRCSSAAHKPVWTEDGSRVKLADGVILQGRHAELLIIPELASFLFIKKC